MNDGKKRRSSAELPAHKRFEKSRSRWIYPSFQNTVFCVLRGLGQRPNKHETGGFRVNGIRLFSQSGYRFALLASIIPNQNNFGITTVLAIPHDGGSGRHRGTESL